jgi:hypothetical protein
MKDSIIKFLLVLVLTFAVASAVSWLWNIVFHGNHAVDWEASARLALILALILTVSSALVGRKST